MESSSAPLVISERQTKSTTQYYYTCTVIAKEKQSKRQATLFQLLFQHNELPYN